MRFGVVDGDGPGDLQALDSSSRDVGSQPPVGAAVTVDHMGPAVCPTCRVAVGVFVRSAAGLVCRSCVGVG